MSETMRTPRKQPRTSSAAKSRAAEKARLEASLAKSQEWQSLQRLGKGRAGKGLLDAIEVASERERLESALAENSEDYRAWIALSGKARGSGDGARQSDEVFKTRVRVKAATAPTSPAPPATVPGPAPMPEPKPVPAAVEASAPPAPATSSPTARGIAMERQSAERRTRPVGVGRGSLAAEEASVVIIRRKRDGTQTRTELPATGGAAAMAGSPMSAIRRPAMYAGARKR